MEKQKIYLKPNVVIEPLFDRWYAWSHLISPATCAMNITGRHLKIMNSYIQAPTAHASAVKSPKMLGGPFIDYDGKRVDEIKELRDKTMEDEAELIAFSNAVKELDTLLKNKAKGYSIEPLYDEVPEILKGYVELIYDLNSNPSFRFFESLVYNKFYKPSSQSVALWLTENDERPFVLSTPRLDEDHIIHLNIPFCHKGLDALSKMKRTPCTINEISELLNIPKEKEDVFNTFFTEDAPVPYQKYTGDKVRMRYFGHACILVETKEVTILIDPLISYYGYPQEVERFSDMDLPEVIDYVLITHNHQDHILFETLISLKHKIKNIVVPRSSNGALQDPNLRLMFENLGFENNIVEISEMETINFHDCEVTGIPFLGEHSDLNIQAKLCHFVRIGEFKMLFVADSCNVESKIYKNVNAIMGDVDVVFLGMECDGAPLSWLYGPLLTEPIDRDKDSTRRLAGSNFERGKALANAFNTKELFVYAMGQEPWCEFISSIKYTDESNPIVQSNKLIEYCNANGIVAERLFGEKEILYSKTKELVL